MSCGHRNRRICREVPENLRQLLESLVDQHVTITLAGEDDPIEVEVTAVVGNMLVASESGCIKFISIECICSVEVECEEALESILRDWR